jgi:hypothetical protein
MNMELALIWVANLNTLRDIDACSYVFNKKHDLHENFVTY